MIACSEHGLAVVTDLAEVPRQRAICPGQSWCHTDVTPWAVGYACKSETPDACHAGDAWAFCRRMVADAPGGAPRFLAGQAQVSGGRRDGSKGNP